MSLENKERIPEKSGQAGLVPPSVNKLCLPQISLSRNKWIQGCHPKEGVCSLYLTKLTWLVTKNQGKWKKKPILFEKDFVGSLQHIILNARDNPKLPRQKHPDQEEQEVGGRMGMGKLLDL